MNGLWTNNKLDEIERNPKVIPRFFSPRIFMKFEIQRMNKKEARCEQTMNQQLDEIKCNGWPFSCGLIRPQTYMRMTTCLCNSQPTVSIFPLRNGSCGVISWYLRLLLCKKNICGLLHHMITYPDSEPKQIIFIYFSGMWPNLEDTSISPGQTLKRWVSSVGCSMVKQDDWPLKVRATHGTSDFFFWGNGWWSSAGSPRPHWWLDDWYCTSKPRCV